MRWEFPPETYMQHLRVTFRDAAAADRATARIAPLFDGYERAVSCRWDDNQEQDLEVKKRLDAHGVKATWYLNSLGAAYHTETDFLPIARTLLKGGNSIGSHTATHPYITYVHRNRAFQELAEARLHWESDLDTLVVSHAFSFIDYRSRAEGDAVQADLIRLLERAGLYHLSVFKNFDDDLRSDMILSIIMPPENAPFDDFVRAVDWAVASEELRERFPLISHSMHAWYGTPLLPQYGLEELDRRLAYLSSFPNFWQCNQNQYAAYRAQYEYGDVGVTRRDGAAVELTVRRPVLRFLNDPVPVTLVFDGIAPDAISGIESTGANAEVSERSGADRVLVNLWHASDQFLPEKVGRVANPENRTMLEAEDEDADFPGLGALLSFDGEELALHLQNVGEAEITDATLTFRLPLGWAEGIATRPLSDLSRGHARTENLRPTRRESDPGLHLGSEHFVAQVDFRFDGQPGRLYATCNFENPPDNSFPKGRFSVLGPIAPEAFDASAFAAAVGEGGAPPTPWRLTDGTTVEWRPGAKDGSIPDEFLHHEVIRTHGDWWVQPSSLYVLYGIVDSPEPRSVRIECARADVPLLILNGPAVTGHDAMLQAGPNHLILAYHHATQMDLACHSGCFLRLTDPATGARMRDITYQLPTQEAPMATQQNSRLDEPKTLSIALLQMTPEGSDEAANLKKADAFCREAAGKGADIALMPEMFNIGYLGFEGTDAEAIAAWQAQAIGRDSAFVRHFADLARELEMAIGVTYLEQWPEAPRNTVTVFDRRGEHVLTYAKIHTCDFAAFEAATTPGEDFHVAELDTAKGVVQLGAMICFDREFPESARILMLQGAELVLVPNACLLDDLRLGQFRTRAYENSMVMAMTNYAHLGGKSVAYGVQGEDLGLADDQEQALIVPVDISGARRFRETSIWGNAFRRPHKYGEMLSLDKQDIWNRTSALGKPFVAEDR